MEQSTAIDGENAQQTIMSIYPYPLARAYQRMVRAAEPVSQHQLALNLIETFLKYLAAISISQYLRDRAAHPDFASQKIDTLLTSLERPSLGDWHAYSRDIMAFYDHPKREGLLVLPELLAFYSHKQNAKTAPAALAASNTIRSLYSPGEGSDATTITFGALAQRLVTYRNRVTHGEPMTKAQICADRMSWLLPALEEMLLFAQFLAQAGLIYVMEAQLNARRAMEHTLQSHTSITDTPPLPPFVTTDFTQALNPNQLYVSRPADFPRPVLPLHPFLIITVCERSTEAQIFMLNGADKKKIEYSCSHCSLIYRPAGAQDGFAWLEDLSDSSDRQNETLDREVTPQPVLEVATVPAPVTEKETSKQPAAAPAKTPHNFQVQRSPLVGREEERADAGKLLLSADVGILTITGTGGIGKTRLALQVGHDMLPHFTDGVYYVSLSSILDPNQVEDEIGQTLGLREDRDRPIDERLKEYLHDKCILLLLDNFEHVIGAAQLVGDLVMSCPNLKALITSRRPLRLQEEHELPLAPLSLPQRGHIPEVGELEQYAAIRLFVQRARAIRPDFKLTKENGELVARICTHLDGLPLAIELAVARIKLLPLRALLTRLEQRFNVLVGGAKDLPPRQQTLRNTFNWSYDLLNDHIKAMFRRLSVFMGGWTIESCEGVCNIEGDLGIDILDEMGTLVDENLLQQSESAEGERRFWMLETIRQYAGEKLAEAGEDVEVKNRHLRWFLKLATDAEPHLRAPDQDRWLAMLEQEHDNLNVALGWSLANHQYEEGLRLAAAIGKYWDVSGYYTEGRDWLEKLLAGANGVPAQVKARALSLKGTLALRQGDLINAKRLSQEALAQSRDLNDRLGIADALLSVAESSYQDDATRAHEQLEESLIIYRELGERRGIATVLARLGWESLWKAHYAEAQNYFQESLEILQEVGDLYGVAYSHILLGCVYRDQGEYEPARAHFEQSLAHFRELGSKVGISLVLFDLGLVARYQRDYARALQLYEEGIDILRDLGETLRLIFAFIRIGQVADDQGDYRRASQYYKDSLVLGKKLGNRRAIAEVLERLAVLQYRQGFTAQAVELLGSVSTLRDSIMITTPLVDKQEQQLVLDAAQKALGEEAYTTAWAMGRARSTEQAIDYVLDEITGS